MKVFKNISCYIFIANGFSYKENCKNNYLFMKFEKLLMNIFI